MENFTRNPFYASDHVSSLYISFSHDWKFETLSSVPVFFREVVMPRPLFDFSSGRFLTTFSAFFRSMLAALARKTSKNFPRAPRASFLPQIWRKVPFWGFWSDDKRIKKLFLLFFPLPVCCRRAQRAEIFVFALGFFCWNLLPTKLEAIENPKFSK